MTPHERARMIDKQEFEAECQAIRQRAIALYEQGKKRDPRVQASINRGATAGLFKANRSRPTTPHNGNSAQQPSIQASIKLSSPKSISSKPLLAVKPKKPKKQPLAAKPKQPLKTWRRGPIGKQYTHNGQTMSADEWVRQIKISISAFRAHLKAGYTLQQVIETPRRVRIKSISKCEDESNNEVKIGAGGGEEL